MEKNEKLVPAACVVGSRCSHSAFQSRTFNTRPLFSNCQLKLLALSIRVWLHDIEVLELNIYIWASDKHTGQDVSASTSLLPFCFRRCLTVLLSVNFFFSPAMALLYCSECVPFTRYLVDFGLRKKYSIKCECETKGRKKHFSLFFFSSSWWAKRIAFNMFRRRSKRKKAYIVRVRVQTVRPTTWHQCCRKSNTYTHLARFAILRLRSWTVCTFKNSMQTNYVDCCARSIHTAAERGGRTYTKLHNL